MKANELRDIYSVSRLNEAARATLESGLGRQWVEGEISNLVRPASGHLYFTLKDSAAQIRCAMFRNRANGLRCRPENGLGVLVYGLVSVYAARGDFQLIVDALEVAGDGVLALRFEQLKHKLHAEGLFDAELKRPLPDWPRAIGVVTSPSGAAVRDIINVLRRRCPTIPVILYPTAVQGEGAAAAIAQALARANARAECDVLIVGRGGGSLEDLWAFNEEIVARAIHASTIPVVSAVGHEIDFTIADLVADVRAPTPSAAAELVSPDVALTRTRLTELQRRLMTDIGYVLAARRKELRQLSQRLISPQRRLEMSYQRTDELAQRLQQGMSVALRLRQGRLDTLCSRVNAVSPRSRLQLATSELVRLRERLDGAMRGQLQRRTQRLEHHHGVLRALGPLATLERGYAIVTDSTGAIVRNSAALSPGQTLETRLARGHFTSTVVSHAAEAPGIDPAAQK